MRCAIAKKIRGKCVTFEKLGNQAKKQRGEGANPWQGKLGFFHEGGWGLLERRGQRKYAWVIEEK